MYHFIEFSVPSDSPQDVNAQAINSSTLLLTWTAPRDEFQNGLIQNYYIRLVERETGILLTFATEEETYQVPNLHPYYQYRYSVAAVTVGSGPYTEEALIQMPEAGADT